MSKHKYTLTLARHTGKPNQTVYGVREYIASWEDIQNDLKNGPVRIIKPPDKIKPN